MFSESDWTLRPKWEIIHSRHVTTVKANASLARMQDSLFSSVNALCFWDGSDVMCAFTGRARAFKRYCATAHGQPGCADRPWRWQVSCLDVSHQNASWVVNISAFWTQACTFDCQRTRYVTYRAMLMLNQKMFHAHPSLGNATILLFLMHLHKQVYKQHSKQHYSLGPSLRVRLIIAILRSVAFLRGWIISDTKPRQGQ